MAEKESPGMLEKVKRGIMTAFESGSSVKKVPIAGTNLPARLARCDTAYNALAELFKLQLYKFDDAARFKYYTIGLTLVNVVIDNLTFIYREHSPVSAAVKKTEDPCMPLLFSCRKILELLKISAETSIEMAKNERGIEQFAGPLAIAKSRLVDDSIGDTEVNLLHGVSELFDLISLPMGQAAEQRRRLLPKNSMQRYLRAEREFSQHYAELCGFIPSAK